MGVGNQEGAENGVHDGVEGAGGEGSDTEGDETDADGSANIDQNCSFPDNRSIARKLGYDEPLESPVVATLGGVRLGDGNGVVHYRGG